MQAIVAADNNWGIGYQNRLLVSIPSDMKFFRQKTTGNVVVMGRKTLESFPNGLPLKNRVNIVLTKNKNYQVKDAVIVHSEEELLEELKKGLSGTMILLKQEHFSGSFTKGVKQKRRTFLHKLYQSTEATWKIFFQLLLCFFEL